MSVPKIIPKPEEVPSKMSMSDKEKEFCFNCGKKRPWPTMIKLEVPYSNGFLIEAYFIDALAHLLLVCNESEREAFFSDYLRDQ